MSNVSDRDNTGTVTIDCRPHRHTHNPFCHRLLGADIGDFACDRGGCRACTVHVDGRRVLSCMTLAAMQESKSDIDFSAAAQRPDSSAP
jgi:aerobic-type carbon monoxide dehydrogenase small subunit (CoxS/CutS family)